MSHPSRPGLARGSRALIGGCVAMIGLAGCGGDSAPPSVVAAPPAEIDADCDVDPSVFPEFEDQVIKPIRFHDQTGLATGCRHVGFEEQTSIIDAFGPPLPSGMTRGSVHLRRADADGTRLLVMWVVAGCDHDARIVASRDGAGPVLTITQRVEGECPPGTGLTAVEIVFSQAISPDDVTTSLSHR